MRLQAGIEAKDNLILGVSVSRIPENQQTVRRRYASRIANGGCSGSYGENAAAMHARHHHDSAASNFLTTPQTSLPNWPQTRQTFLLAGNLSHPSASPTRRSCLGPHHSLAFLSSPGLPVSECTFALREYPPLTPNRNMVMSELPTRGNAPIAASRSRACHMPTHQTPRYVSFVLLGSPLSA